jgi:MFS family permease
MTSHDELEPTIDKLLITLACTWVALAGVRRLAAGSRAPAESPASVASAAALRSLQWRYLPAWLCFKAADWMQGSYFHEVYSSMVDPATGAPLSQRAISALFLAGFVSSAVVGTAAGSLVDSYGRRAGCLAFSVVYSASALSVLASELPLLAAGRLLGGVATSLLMSAPEAWLCSEHARLGLPPSTLGGLFGWAYFADSIVAILAGQVRTPGFTHPRRALATWPQEGVSVRGGTRPSSHLIL